MARKEFEEQHLRQLLGDDNLTTIYTLARKYALMGVKLFFNNYGCETSGTKMAKFFSVVKDLYAKGLIDGMGFQMHLTTSYGENCQIGGLAAIFAAYSKLGLSIHITEMDVGCPDPELQAVWNAKVANISKDNPMSEAFMVWGVMDRDSYRPQATPLLFYIHLSMKPAYEACARPIMGPAMPLYYRTGHCHHLCHHEHGLPSCYQ